MQWFRGTTGVGIYTALVFSIFPFVTSEHLFYGSINAKYFFLLTAGTLLGVWFAYRIWSGKHLFSFRHRWLLFLVLLVVGSGYLSALLGIFTERSFFSDILRSTGILYLTYLAAFAYFASELLVERDWSLVRRAIAVSGALFSLLTIVGRQGLGFSEKIFTVNFANTGVTLGNETFAGAYLLLVLLVTLIEFFRAETNKQKIAFGVLLAVQFLSPLFLNLRELFVDFGAVIANPFALVGLARASSVTAVLLVVYLVGTLAIHRWGSLRYKIYLYGGWALLWILGIATLLALLFTPGTSVQERYVAESTAARIIVWETGWEAIKERPMLGWGPENFRMAFEQHFDNRLYLDENLGEVWFDRAHNIFIDTLVSVGLLGMTLLGLLALYVVVVAVRAARIGIISSTEGQLLAAFPVAHIFQLQTGFDTVATYGLAGLLLGYIFFLERQLSSSSLTLSSTGRRIVAGCLVAALLIGGYINVREYHRQKELFRIFVTPSALAQEAHIRAALSQYSDFETFRLASASLTKGLLAQLADPNIDPAMLAAGVKQLTLYEEFLRGYIAKHPEDYRTRMNFAYILFLQTILGTDKLEEAKTVIKSSYELSPGNPLTYVMESLAELYSGNLSAAQVKIDEAVALNPDIEFTQNIRARILKQVGNFPEITVIPLENL